MITLDKYIIKLVHDKEIEEILKDLVKGFAKVWFTGADSMDRQRAWNNSGVTLKVLDGMIRRKIRSDRNKDGFAVDLGV